MQAVYRILVGPQVGANFGIYALVNSTDWFDAMILNNPFRWVRAVVLPIPSCSKIQPSVKACADSRLADPSPRVTGRISAFFGTVRRMLNTPFETSF